MNLHKVEHERRRVNTLPSIGPNSTLYTCNDGFKDGHYSGKSRSLFAVYRARFKLNLKKKLKKIKKYIKKKLTRTVESCALRKLSSP